MKTVLTKVIYGAGDPLNEVTVFDVIWLTIGFAMLMSIPLELAFALKIL